MDIGDTTLSSENSGRLDLVPGVGRGVLELSASLQNGRVSSKELVEASFERIGLRDGAINAVVELNQSATRQAAAESDARRAGGSTLGPLDGIPFGVKDNIDVLGFRTTGGLGAATQAGPVANDAVSVARLRAAGAVPVAKLNLNEAALGACNHNSHLGDCFNPHAQGYTPGGSSGGSAAAVAAGYFPFALGTDTMGSVRIPAAYCGVLGFKASFGRINTSGTLVVSRRLDHVGPITAKLEDLSLLLDVLESYDDMDPWSRRYEELAGPSGEAPPRQSGDNSSLRLAYPQDLSAVAVEGNVEEPFLALIETLKAAGHSLIPVDLSQLDLGALRRSGLMICEADMLSTSAHWFENDSAVSENLQGLLSWVRGKSALDLARADNALDSGARALGGFLDGAHAFISPTTPQRPFPMTDPVPAGQADLTSLANMAGAPALSLPLRVNEGLPVGLQVVASRGEDRQLLAVAESLVRSSRGMVSDRALGLEVSQSGHV